MLAADIPKVTDWMQAWGSLLGVGVSSLAVIITGLLLRHEMRARREERADADAAQARLVAGEIRGEVRDGGSIVGIDWAVHNYSEAPIFEVYVSFKHRHLDPDWFIGSSAKNPQVILPGGHELGTWRCAQPLPGSRGDDEDFSLLENMDLKVRFLDASGFEWQKVGSFPPRRIVGRRTQSSEFWSITWGYIWPVSYPMRWISQRHKMLLGKVEAHMRRRILARADRQVDRLRRRKRS
ncbi:hypothetical protein [Plantactinospora sp. DSM 117369]